jgi:hypothetical protein
MKPFLSCLTLSLFAVVSSLQAADDKAPAPKPVATDAKAKAAPAAAVSPDADCGCGTETVCKMPVRKIAMSPKAAALLATK